MKRWFWQADHPVHSLMMSTTVGKASILPEMIVILNLVTLELKVNPHQILTVMERTRGVHQAMVLPAVRKAMATMMTITAAATTMIFPMITMVTVVGRAAALDRVLDRVIIRAHLLLPGE